MKKALAIIFLVCICFATMSLAGCKGPMGPIGPAGPEGPQGEKGDSGISIVWKGELASPPANAQLNWAYFNTTIGNAYIYDGTSWQLLAQHGAQGAAGAAGAGGISLAWQGSRTSHPADPELNWAYYNSDDKVSYIFNGEDWVIMARDGEIGPEGPKGDPGADGSSISWRGEHADHPSGAQLNWAYYNTTLGIAYIYNGTTWQVLSQDGAPGEDGTDGSSISWQGTFSSHPSNPEINWAYYNSEDKKSYIFTDDGWEVLAQDGTDGISISWRGNLSEHPENPQLNWAYYNTTLGIAYIYYGTT